MTESVRNLIVENIYKIKSECREIEEIVFGEEAYQNLANELGLSPDHKLPIKEFLGYPVRVLSYLPSDYIALRFKMREKEYEELDEEEIEIERLKIAFPVWTIEFSLSNIYTPNLIIERCTKEFARHILLACYLPGSPITESKETIKEKTEFVPESVFDHIKDCLRKRFPKFFSRLDVNYRKISVQKTIIVKKIGVHPSFFDIKHPLGSCYVLRYSLAKTKKKEKQ